MSRNQATATQMIDDPRVRVTRFDFASGEETGWHEHGFDYVITAVSDCQMLIEEPGGETRTVLVEAGTSYRRDKGVRHNVINDGDKPMSFVEVELK
ncbi:MAG: cupin domain-containing protein [Pseudomonadota bacterium]